MPGVDVSFLKELVGGVGPDVDAVVAVNEMGQDEPLCAVYGAGALPAVQQALATGLYRVRGRAGGATAAARGRAV